MARLTDEQRRLEAIEIEMNFMRLRNDAIISTIFSFDSLFSIFRLLFCLFILWFVYALLVGGLGMPSWIAFALSGFWLLLLIVGSIAQIGAIAEKRIQLLRNEKDSQLQRIRERTYAEFDHSRGSSRLSLLSNGSHAELERPHINPLHRAKHNRYIVVGSVILITLLGVTLHIYQSNRHSVASVMHPAVNLSNINVALPGEETIPQIASITTGSCHPLALLSNGTVIAWGSNEFGQLGDGTTTDRSAPVIVPELSNVTAIAAGTWHSLALLEDGTVRAWGYNWYGQLGDATTTDRRKPVSVSELSGVTAIAAGDSHSLALLSDGTVRAWGWNYDGRLGDGTTTNRNAPVSVRGLSGVIAIAAGSSHSLALLSDGTIHSWGDNRYGQLGDAVNQSLPEEEIGSPELRIDDGGQVLDSFLSAAVLTGDSGSVTVSSVGATIEVWERWQSLDDAGGASLWWIWRAPADGQVVFDALGSDFDTVLGLYVGLSLDSLEVLSENDDAGDGLQSRVVASVVAVQAYRVRVDGYSGAAGLVQLNWELTP